nr:28S ribosomal protein S15, mitochondrial [Manis javanica]
MLRAVWRALGSLRTPAVTQAPGLGVPGGECARLPPTQWGLSSPPGGEEPRNPTAGAEDTAWALPSSVPSLHPLWFVVSVVALTVKIRNYEEHMQKHRKDKAHKRRLLMSIDQRNKMLKNLRKTNYNVFEKACKELGIVYTIPPLHIQKNHRRFMTKKALCIQVFQEVQKLKKQKRALKAAAAAQKQGLQNPESPSNPDQRQ